MVGQKLFLCRVGRGANPRPVGFARPYSSREKRSPRRRLRALRVRPMGESSLRTAIGSAVHFGTRAALCERQPLQMPINAVAARGGCVCALCRPSAVVSAIRGESRRRSRRKKSAAVSGLTSSPEICRALLARAKCLKSTVLWL